MQRRPGGECRALRDENRLLKEQPAKNSRNSSKPPSSDGYRKPAPKSLRKPGDRPSGGQKGHKGRTLRMVEKPDKAVPHTVEQRERCGSSLADRAPDRVEQRQVFDIPEPEWCHTPPGTLPPARRRASRATGAHANQAEITTGGVPE